MGEVKTTKKGKKVKKVKISKIKATSIAKIKQMMMTPSYAPIPAAASSSSSGGGGTIYLPHYPQRNSVDELNLRNQLLTRDSDLRDQIRNLSSQIALIRADQFRSVAPRGSPKGSVAAGTRQGSSVNDEQRRD